MDIITITHQIVDIESELVGFYAAQPGLAAIFGANIWTATFPLGAGDQNFPALTIARSGGGDDLSEVPLDAPMIQHQVWGKLQDYPAALAAAYVVRSLLLEWMQLGWVNTGTVQAGCAGTTQHVTMASPDGSARPLVIIDASFTVRPL